MSGRVGDVLSCRKASLSGIVLVLTLLLAPVAGAETPVQRGDYLVNGIMACGNCHTPKDADGVPIAGKALSGGTTRFDTPSFTVVAPNITPDRETGIGDWTNDEIRRALIEGIRPGHGRLASVPLAAIMPANFYKALMPHDLDAIIAYLRSVQSVSNSVQPPVYKAPVKREIYPNAERAYSEEALSTPVARGTYLTTIGHCMECHSLRVKGVSDFGPGLGAGGREFSPSFASGFPSRWQGAMARNITSHPLSGLGAWSDAEIKRAITQGISRDGRIFEFPMAISWYAHMTESDLDAIVAWLRTVPPVE
jgi:mono/diheme cytochrome c family protein